MALIAKTTIRGDVEYNLGFASGTENATRIDAIIDRVYEEEIPQLVKGSAKRRQLVFNTVAGDEEYDLDALAAADGWTFYGIRSRLILLADTPLAYETDPEKFWLGYTLSDTQQSRPTGALHDGRTLVLRQIPDAAYQVALWASGSRDAFPGTGVTRLEANVITELVTFHRAKELGMERTMATYTQALEVSLPLLSAKFKASVPAREAFQHPGF